MRLVDVVGEDGALARAAAAESSSEHPIARAVVDGGAERGVAASEATDFRSVAGFGVRARVDGEQVLVGRRRFLEEDGCEVPAWLADETTRLETDGKTVFWVGWGGKARAALAVADALKPSAAETIRALNAMGVEVVMITGDNRATAEAIAKEAGIERVLAEVLPAEKVDEVRRLQAEGKVTAIRLSRRTFRTIVQNLFWAFGYNVVLIPLAAAGLLNPILAGAAMAFSSVSVVSNSLRLRRFQA
jgi:cation transport ATPase